MGRSEGFSFRQSSQLELVIVKVQSLAAKLEIIFLITSMNVIN